MPYLLSYSKEGVLAITNLINGKMITLVLESSVIGSRPRAPKIEALHRLINMVNQRLPNPIPLLPLDTTPFGSNVWLAGFTDSDGNFEVASMTNIRKEYPG